VGTITDFWLDFAVASVLPPPTRESKVDPMADEVERLELAEAMRLLNIGARVCF